MLCQYVVHDSAEGLLSLHVTYTTNVEEACLLCKDREKRHPEQTVKSDPCVFCNLYFIPLF